MRLTLLAIVFYSQLALAQGVSVSPVKSYCDWTNTCLDKIYKPSKYDTCLYVISTRHYRDTINNFVDYEYDTTAQLRYFAVYFQGNSWITVPKKNLSDLLASAQLSDNLVVYTEGLGKTFNSAVYRGTRMMREYGVQTLIFDWPTQRPYMKSGKNFWATYKVSEQVALPYARFVDSLQHYELSHPKKYESVNLFFHSMGNLVLMHALKHHYFDALQPKVFDNVVLNAACVPSKNHKQWLETLAISKNVYVTQNNHDMNLNGAKVILMKHQLGERSHRPYARNATYINFSNALSMQHNYFLMQPLLTNEPFIRHFYAAVFTGQRPALNDSHFRVEESTPNKVECYVVHKKDVELARRAGQLLFDAAAFNH